MACGLTAVTTLDASLNSPSRFQQNINLIFLAVNCGDAGEAGGKQHCGVSVPKSYSLLEEIHLQVCSIMHIFKLPLARKSKNESKTGSSPAAR